MFLLDGKGMIFEWKDCSENYGLAPVQQCSVRVS